MGQQGQTYALVITNHESIQNTAVTACRIVTFEGQMHSSCGGILSRTLSKPAQESRG